jgi:hypothetical protein
LFRTSGISFSDGNLGLPSSGLGWPRKAAFGRIGVQIMKHTEKIALITGASRDLGRATALKLARDGADGIVTYRQRKEAATRGKFRG